MSINSVFSDAAATASVTTLPRKVVLVALHFVLCLALLWYNDDFSPDIIGTVLDTYVLRPFDEVAIGIAFALVPLIWLPDRLELPSQIFGYILYLAAYISFCTIGLQSISLPIEQVLPFMALSCFAVIGIFVQSTIWPPKPIARRGMPTNRLMIGIGLVTLAIVVLAVLVIGVDLRPLDITDVYDLRDARKEQFATGDLWLWGYILPPLGLVLGPGILCAGFERKRWYLLLIGMAISYVAYQTSGQKDPMGAALICVAAFFVWRGPGRGPFTFSTTRIVVSMILLLAFVTLYDRWTADPFRLAGQLTIGRVFVVPGLLEGYWVEFFSINPQGGYAGRGLLGLVFGRELVYGMALPYVIGLQYFGNEGTSANVGMWADAYGQLGNLGVILASLLAIGALRLLDRLSIDRDPRYVLTLCIPMAFSLTNGSINNILLTNGMWMMFVIIYFMAPQTNLTLGKSILEPATDPATG